MSDGRIGCLEGRVAVVTGAGSGTGRATARRMAAEGASVVVADIMTETADATVAHIVADGGIATAVTVDVSDEAAVQHMIAAATDTYGRLDVLHNNAAALGADVYGRDLGVAELDLEVWQKAMSVNLTGVLARLQARSAGHAPIGGWGDRQHVVDGGPARRRRPRRLRGLEVGHRVADPLRGQHVRADRIRCNAVAPGLILSETSLAALSERQLAEFNIEQALPWSADPADIAAAVVWLASDESRCITGQTIVVDSGIMVRRPLDTLPRLGAGAARTRLRSRGQRMKFGFMVPRESDFGDGGDPYGRIYDLCQRAEDLGFDFGTFTHHRFSPERPFLSDPSC